MKLNNPTSNTKVIISIQYRLIDFPYSIFYQIRQHIQLSFVLSRTTLLPSPHLQTYNSTLSKCTRISFQFNLSSQTPPPRSCASINFWLRINTSRHKHGSTRYTSARMQHTFTPVCIVKPVFSLVTGHASLL